MLLMLLDRQHHLQRQAVRGSLGKTLVARNLISDRRASRCVQKKMMAENLDQKNPILLLLAINKTKMARIQTTNQEIQTEIPRINRIKETIGVRIGGEMAAGPGSAHQAPGKMMTQQHRERSPGTITIIDPNALRAIIWKN